MTQERGIAAQAARRDGIRRRHPVAIGLQPGGDRVIESHYRASARASAQRWALVASLAVTAAARPIATAVAASAPSCSAFDHEHRAWTRLLEQYVKDGRVDYAGLRREARPALSGYLDLLSAVSRTCYARWMREQRLAFWINAYNAYAVELILEHYPVRSIRAIGWWPGAAFRTKFIPMKDFTGGDLSLEDVEHEHLRKEFREPRIHFAIVCASVSCPPLRSEAYRATDLERQLDDQARRFLADPTKNRFDPKSRTLHLSSIFKWFRGDFEGTLPAFVARYVDPATAAALREPGVRVEFLDYDWSLNGR